MAACVTGGEELRALAARLKGADASLRRNLRKALRDAGGPLARAAQDAILSSPSKHDGTLRREVANTVTTATSITGSQVTLEIVSYGARMPEGKGNLPAYLEDDRRWKHPVFGRPLAELEAQVTGRGHGRGWTWVAQSSHAPGWFTQSIAAHADEAEAAVQAAMDETRRQLEGLGQAPARTACRTPSR